MYATALAAFIAATIGSFLGAYFKEYLFDRFNKNRRKREIRIELVKNLSKFYGLMKRYTINRNMHEFEVCKLDHIQSEAGALNWNDKDGVVDYQRRVAGQFENAKLLAGKHEADTNELTEIESNIKAYIVEASYYFPSHVFKQLNKTVAEGFKGDVIAADYRSMSREELYAFYPEAYRKAVTEKRDYVSNLREKTINSVAEILRE